MDVSYTEILQYMEEDFHEDFQFVDIEDDMFKNNIFTVAEIKEIKAITSVRGQIEKMIFFLVYKSKDVSEFFKALRHSYDWLQRRFFDDYALKASELHAIKMYKEAITNSNLPNLSEHNIHRIEYIWDIQQKLKLLDENKRPFLFVYSKLGLGKTCLVSNACNNFLIVKKMNYAIFYLNVNKCSTPEHILEHLERLKIMLQSQNDINMKRFGENSSKTNVENEILTLKHQLKVMIRTNSPNCLLILANVRNERTIHDFNLQCKTLITTRDRNLINCVSKTKRLEVHVEHGFTEDESKEYLKRCLGRTVDLPIEAVEIHKKCQGNPFVMALVGRNLAEYGGSERRWQSWLEALNNYQLNQQIRYPIEESLHALSTEYREYFKSLVIFKEEIDIPVKVLQKYWNCSDRETEDIVDRFHKNGLLEIRRVAEQHSSTKHQSYESSHSADEKEMVCSMHYLYCAYLTNNVTPNAKRTFHRQLVNSYRIQDLPTNGNYDDVTFPNDGYFLYYIGYHLKDAEILDMFPKFFLNFEFLEQKIRFTGLPNTIGDLNYFNNEIVGDDNESSRRAELLDELVEFLPNVEILLIKSEYSSLLQYAITMKNIIGEEAKRQMDAYPSRVWFDDIDHSHKHRQVVKVDKKPNFLRFLDANTALISFSDAEIHLLDLSSNYTAEPTSYRGHQGHIIDIEAFGDDTFISLDNLGIMRIWTLNNTPVNNRRSSGSSSQTRQKNHNIPKHNGKCVQTIPENIDSGKQTSPDWLVTCFCILHDGSQIAVCTNKGWVYIYDWGTDNKFKRNVATFKSLQENMYLITPVEVSSVMIVSKTESKDECKLVLYDLTSTAPRLNIGWNYGRCLNMFYDHYKRRIIFVFSKYVIEMGGIQSYLDTRNLTDLEIQTIELEVENTCCAITYDLKYIILGTVNGILVFNRDENVALLHANVSDKIVSVDVYPLDDDTYKYVLISSSTKAGNVINMYSLMVPDYGRELKWASDKMGSPINSNTDLKKSSTDLNTWLLGGKYFDVYLEEEGQMILLTVDSKKNFKLIQYHDRKMDFQQATSNRISLKTNVTAFTKFDHFCAIGCKDGLVLLVQFDSEVITCTELFEIRNTAITFLKHFNQDYLMIGSRDTMAVIKEESKEILYSTEGCEIVEAYELDDESIICICSNCIIMILNITEGNVEMQVFDPPATENIWLTYGASAINIYKNYLIIGTNEGAILHYRLEILDSKIDVISGAFKHYNGNDNPIMSISISADNSLAAVGYKNGCIQLFNTETLELTNELNSLTSPILYLEFSPFLGPNSPNILVSLSDQIVFWNVTYVLNNAISIQKNSPQRRSQRFKKKNIKYPSPSDGQTLFLAQKTNKNPWIGKIGPARKPEILSSLKFLGTSAEKLIAMKDFTEFITIDNEGNVYFLRLVDKMTDENDVI